jgi:hypothetical protein
MLTASGVVFATVTVRAAEPDAPALSVAVAVRATDPFVVVAVFQLKLGFVPL